MTKLHLREATCEVEEVDCEACNSAHWRQRSSDCAAAEIVCWGTLSVTWFTPLRFSWCVGCRSWTVPCQATPLFGLRLCSSSCVEDKTSFTYRTACLTKLIKYCRITPPFISFNKSITSDFFLFFFSSRGMLVRDLEQQNNPAIQGITPHSQSAL